MLGERRELKLSAIDVCGHARPKAIVDLLRIDAAVIRIVVNAEATGQAWAHFAKLKVRRNIEHDCWLKFFAIFNGCEATKHDLAVA
jgi:hypothetical protein